MMVGAFIKRLSIVVAVAAALILSGLWVLRLRFPPERLKAMAVERLQKSLGREVRIGSVGLGWRGLELKAVEVSQDKGFATGTLLSAASLSARWDLRALLQRQVRIERVLLQDASLDYIDTASGIRLSLSNLSATLIDFKTEGPFPVLADFQYSGSWKNSPASGSVEFRGALDLGGGKGKLSARLDPLRLKLKDLSFKADGSVQRDAQGRIDVDLAVEMGETSFKVEGKAAPDIDLRASAERVSLSFLSSLLPELKAFAPAGRLDGDFRIVGPPDSIEVSGAARASGLEMVFSGLALRDGKGTLRFDSRSISADLSGAFTDGALELKARAENYRKAPNITLTGTLSSLNLSGLSAQPAGQDPPPKRGAPPPAGGAPPDKPAATQAAPLKTSGAFSIGKVSHPRFQAQSVSLHWSLTGLTPELSMLGGSAKLSVGPGRLDDLKTLVDKSPMAKLLLFPIVALQKAAGVAKIRLLPAFDRVSFKEITGEYAFRQGVMTVQESHMDSSAAFVRTTGTADLANNRLDLRISTRLAPRLGVDIAGPIGFFVRGTLDNPSVKPDVGAVLKQPEVQKAIEQGKKLFQNIFK